MASHPSLKLCPSTNQYGVPSVRTCRRIEVELESSTFTVAPEVSSGAPRGATVVAVPAALDDRTTRSTSMPASSPTADVTVWLPASRATGPVQLSTPKPRRASATAPVRRTATGSPSIRSRSSRHSPLIVIGSAGVGTPARPTVASDTGRVSGRIASLRSGSTGRYVSTTSWNHEPVTGGNDTGTVVTCPGAAPSAMAGSEIVRTLAPSTSRCSCWGTECRPSATTPSVIPSTVSGLVRTTPTGLALLRTDVRGPRGRRVGIERTRRARVGVALQVARGHEGRARCGGAERAVDHLVGGVGVHACGAREAERPRVGEHEPPVQRELLVLVGAVGGLVAQARHHDVERVVGRPPVDRAW